MCAHRFPNTLLHTHPLTLDAEQQRRRQHHEEGADEADEEGEGEGDYALVAASRQLEAIVTDLAVALNNLGSVHAARQEHGPAEVRGAAGGRGNEMAGEGVHLSVCLAVSASLCLRATLLPADI